MITKNLLSEIQKADEAGAACVSYHADVRQAAGEVAVERFEEACLKGKLIHNLNAWAWKVGMHAALHYVRQMRYRVTAIHNISNTNTSSLVLGGAGFQDRIHALLSSSSIRLTDRQRRVLARIRADLSIKANSQLLRMAPFSLRRMLKCIQERIAHDRPHA